MTTTLLAFQKQRRDTAANWTSVNPTLLAGEIGIESDTGYWKVGDGTTAWTSLAYLSGLGAEIPVSRLADGTARQLLQTAANGNDVEWTSNVDIPGTLDITGTATFDGIASHPLGTAAAPTITFTGDLNTGIYSSGADQVSVATGGTERLRIDSTGQIEAVSLGTAAAPAYTWVGDPNTGIYSPGADQVAISTNGTGRLFVASDGKVGVGTSSPAATLDSIAESTNGYGVRIRGRASDGFGAIQFTSNDGASQQAAIGVASNTLVISTGSNERVRIDSSGRLGLGTSSPSWLLQVAGNAAVIQEDSFLGVDATTSPRLGIVKKSGAFPVFAAGSATAITFSHSSASDISGVSSNTYTPRLTIDTSGRVGIGSNLPNQLLHINSSAASGGQLQITNASTGTTSTDGLLIGYDGSNDVLINNQEATALKVNVNGSEALRVDSSRRLLVGTSTAGGTELIQVQGTSGGSNLPGGIALRRSSLGNGDDIGYVNFTNASGNIHAGIKAFADGTPGASDYPGALVFSTTADGASSPTERMRIRNDGRILLGTTTDGGAGGLTVRPSASEGAAQLIFDRTNTTNTSTVVVFENNDGTVGTITYSNTAVAYNTTSDYRLKENVVPLTGAANRLNQLQVHRFNFIADPDKTVDGFLAHEAQAVVPECVTGTKDEIDNEGNPVYQGIDQSKLVPLLTAALQEALAEIASLKNRVAALEAQ